MCTKARCWLVRHCGTPRRCPACRDESVRSSDTRADLSRWQGEAGNSVRLMHWRRNVRAGRLVVGFSTATLRPCPGEGRGREAAPRAIVARAKWSRSVERNCPIGPPRSAGQDSAVLGRFGFDWRFRAACKSSEEARTGPSHVGRSCRTTARSVRFRRRPRGKRQAQAAQECSTRHTGQQEPARRSNMLKAVADVLRAVGGAIATVVTLPFRAVARLFGGASASAHGHH